MTVPNNLRNDLVCLRTREPWNSQVLEYDTPRGLAINLAPLVPHAARPRCLEQLDVAWRNLLVGEQHPPCDPVRAHHPTPPLLPNQLLHADLALARRRTPMLSHSI
jgi:hypothetical protein